MCSLLLVQGCKQIRRWDGLNRSQSRRERRQLTVHTAQPRLWCWRENFLKRGAGWTCGDHRGGPHRKTKWQEEEIMWSWHVGENTGKTEHWRIGLELVKERKSWGQRQAPWYLRPIPDNWHKQLRGQWNIWQIRPSCILFPARGLLTSWCFSPNGQVPI